jgi:hypothetical protein
VPAQAGTQLPTLLEGEEASADAMDAQHPTLGSAATTDGGASDPLNGLLTNGGTHEWEIDAAEIELGPRIGIGSFGEVFRGTWRHTDVAVKRFLEQDLSPQLLAVRSHGAIMPCQLGSSLAQAVSVSGRLQSLKGTPTLTHADYGASVPHLLAPAMWSSSLGE